MSDKLKVRKNKKMLKERQQEREKTMYCDRKKREKRGGMRK